VRGLGFFGGKKEGHSRKKSISIGTGAREPYLFGDGGGFASQVANILKRGGLTEGGTGVDR